MIFLVFLFGLVSIITAFWGPRKWLLISGIAGFFTGLSIGFLKGLTKENFLLGLFLGVLLGLFQVFSGWRTKIGVEHGLRVLEKLGIIKKK